MEDLNIVKHLLNILAVSMRWLFPKTKKIYFLVVTICKFKCGIWSHVAPQSNYLFVIFQIYFVYQQIYIPKDYSQVETIEWLFVTTWKQVAHEKFLNSQRQFIQQILVRCIIVSFWPLLMEENYI